MVQYKLLSRGIFTNYRISAYPHGTAVSEWQCGGSASYIEQLQQIDDSYTERNVNSLRPSDAYMRH